MTTIMQHHELLHNALEYTLKKISETHAEQLHLHQLKVGTKGTAPNITPSITPEEFVPVLSAQQINALVEDACAHFNLGPIDAESMLRILQERNNEAETPPKAPTCR